jgi:hypothetical protein
MKKLIAAVLVLGCASLAFMGMSGTRETASPGQVDFGAFAAPGNGAEFVEVNLTSNLISLASKLFDKQEPDVAKLLTSVELVHVAVIGLDDDNKSDLRERAEKVRKQMDGKGWERIVAAQKDDKDVSVYLKSQNKDTVQGIVVMAMERGQKAVFVNIVGDIKPEQIAMLGETLHIDPLKKLGESTQGLHH